MGKSPDWYTWWANLLTFLSGLVVQPYVEGKIPLDKLFNKLKYNTMENQLEFLQKKQKEYQWEIDYHEKKLLEAKMMYGFFTGKINELTEKDELFPGTIEELSGIKIS